MKIRSLIVMVAVFSGLGLSAIHVSAKLDEEKKRAELNREYQLALKLLDTLSPASAPCASSSSMLYAKAIQLAGFVGDHENGQRLLKKAHAVTTAELEACLDLRPVTTADAR